MHNKSNQLNFFEQVVRAVCTKKYLLMLQTGFKDLTLDASNKLQRPYTWRFKQASKTFLMMLQTGFRYLTLDASNRHQRPAS